MKHHVLILAVCLGIAVLSAAPAHSKGDLKITVLDYYDHRGDVGFSSLSLSFFSDNRVEWVYRSHEVFKSGEMRFSFETATKYCAELKKDVSERREKPQHEYRRKSGEDQKDVEIPTTAIIVIVEELGKAKDILPVRSSKAFASNRTIAPLCNEITRSLGSIGGPFILFLNAHYRPGEGPAVGFKLED